MSIIDLDCHDFHTLVTPVIPPPVPIRWQRKAPELQRLSLDRYRPVARLGHGGMAEVFLAAWEVAPYTYRPVVLKRMHAQFGEDPRLVQMFLDEARLVCQLLHPNIVKALEVGTLEGRYCLAMEYLEGQPLDRLVERAYARGELRIELAVQVAIAVLAALHHAHEARDADGQPLDVVHRDISPQNIFVCNDGTVKVLDFGIAKTTLREGRTSSGIVKGKVAYIAPEQAGTDPVDRRADVWSVGVVLWEALTGMRLFQANTDAATLNLMLKAQVPPARRHRPDLPAELDAILMFALQPTPGLRYPNAAAMQERLSNWLETRAPEDGADLSRTMRELFANEIAEQRRLLSELIMPRNRTPLNDAGAPNSMGGVVVSNVTPLTAEHLLRVTNHVEQLTRQNRAFARSLFAAVAVAAVAVALLVYVGGARFQVAPAQMQPVNQATQNNLAVAPHGYENRAVAAQAEQLPVHLEEVHVQAERGQVPASLPRTEPAASGRSPEGRAGASRAADEAATKAILSLPRVTASDLGFLTIDTVPWSIVSVKGKQIGQTPLVGVKLKPGTQTLTLQNPELGISMEYPLTIQPGKTLVRRIGIE